MKVNVLVESLTFWSMSCPRLHTRAGKFWGPVPPLPAWQTEYHGRMRESWCCSEGLEHGHVPCELLRWNNSKDMLQSLMIVSGMSLRCSRNSVSEEGKRRTCPGFFFIWLAKRKLRLDFVIWRYMKIPAAGPWEVGGRESPLVFWLSLRSQCHRAYKADI